MTQEANVLALQVHCERMSDTEIEGLRQYCIGIREYGAAMSELHCAVERVANFRQMARELAAAQRQAELAERERLIKLASDGAVAMLMLIRESAADLLAPLGVIRDVQDLYTIATKYGYIRTN